MLVCFVDTFWEQLKMAVERKVWILLYFVCFEPVTTFNSLVMIKIENTHYCLRDFN